MSKFRREHQERIRRHMQDVKGSIHNVRVILKEPKNFQRMVNILNEISGLKYGLCCRKSLSNGSAAFILGVKPLFPSQGEDAGIFLKRKQAQAEQARRCLGGVKLEAEKAKVLE